MCNKVVLDYSSLLGDHCENAETIHKNHMQMCRFYGIEDPNFRKVVGALQLMYDSIPARDAQGTLDPGSQPGATSEPQRLLDQGLTASEKSRLQSLWFASPILDGRT